MRQPIAAPDWKVERADDAVRLSGTFRTTDGTEIIDAFRASAPGDGAAVTLDLDHLTRIDAGVVMLMLNELTSRGAQLELRNAGNFKPLFDLCMEGCAWLRRRTRPPGLVETVGMRTTQRLEDWVEVVEYTGEMAVSAVRLGRRPSRAHWAELPELIERAGTDALPIVLLLNFLIGFVTAFMSTRVLAQFGANILVADLVALAVTRQLGPLITAIIIAGRSGAAFAAELGSMRVAQEIDAIRTLGLEPFSWLVVPRVLALVLVTPILTLLGDLVGMLGGALVGIETLGLTTRQYVRETQHVLNSWDVESGLWMSLAFAAAIGLIACAQGLSASGGAVGVGKRTTKTVVHSLFAIILLDAVFTILFRAFGLS